MSQVRNITLPLLLMLGLAAPVYAQDAVPAAAPSAPAANTPPPLSAYGNLPSIEDVDLSPDGSRSAAVASGNGKRQLVVLNEFGEIIGGIPLADQKIRSIRWAGNDFLIVNMTTTDKLYDGGIKQEFAVTSVINLKARGKVYWVFDSSNDILPIVGGAYGIRQIDGRWYAFWGGYRSNANDASLSSSSIGYFLFRVDLETGQAKAVAKGDLDGFSRDWLLDERGGIVATMDRNSNTGKWSIRNSAKTTIANGEQIDRGVGMAGLSPDGAHLIYSTFDSETEDYEYFEIALADGTLRATPSLPEEADGLFLGETHERVMGWGIDEYGALPKFFDEAHNKNMRALKRAFPNSTISIVDVSENLGMIVFKTTGPGDAGTWYQLDVANRNAWPLGQDYPDVPIEYVAEIRTIEYTAQDGLPMEMIVTLPPGREPANLPVIMFPHGGPHSHDEPRFDYWAQAMASRGYAVVQPNFRGSTNKDTDFMEAGYGEWGGKMQTDVSDALAHLASIGMVDPNRACIVGASYGGYAALAGVTLQQGIYKCAVSVAGVSDLPLMRRDDLKTTNHEQSLGRYFDRAIGKGRDLKLLSPITFAERADAPVLLIHGKDDTVVYINQSDRMADALKDEKKPVEYVILKGEDHWLSRGDTRLAMLEAVVAFVEKHNPAVLGPPVLGPAGVIGE